MLTLLGFGLHVGWERQQRRSQKDGKSDEAEGLHDDKSLLC